MSGPRLEVRLDLIQDNARALVRLLRPRGIAAMGVTKAVLGTPHVARVLLAAGMTSLGDARVENLRTIRQAGLTAPLTLIRSPMITQVDEVVALAESSHNTEVAVIARLAEAAKKQGRRHGVVLMVELGDLREGVAPSDLEPLVRQTLSYPNIELRGIGANLACQNGVSPDSENMGVLSGLADALERTFGTKMNVVSGGNSANLEWALETPNVGRVNELRLGESVLLGRDPLSGRAISGLHPDAFCLVGEVIELQRKPTMPWGQIEQSAFGPPVPRVDRGMISQAIIAIGRQDVDPAGLEAPPGRQILGASSDHLVIDAGRIPLVVGSELRFKLNYSALLHAMTSPFVCKSFSRGSDRERARGLRKHGLTTRRSASGAVQVTRPFGGRR